jgi:two-component system, chemotaxis family, CheB/CheR fusion protein
MQEEPPIPGAPAARNPEATRDPGTLQGVVGIGASAGGLEALEEFFAHTPRDTGLAFVVIQHLSPDFKSLMDELLARRTRMPVHRVEPDMQVEPNAIYVIPPKVELRLDGERLRLTLRQTTNALHLPIDVFFESLATSMGDRAVAVVLSGTGSDGSRGIRSVRERGGLVLVQTPESAQFDGMPRAAIDTGVVDVVGSAAELPHLAIDLLRGGGSREGPLAEAADPGLAAVLMLLKRGHALDFSHYKPSTIRRRIERRLLLKRTHDVGDYVERLEQDPKELEALYRDLLIGVTRFFRDAEAFRTLQTEIIPALLARAEHKEEIRVWVAGCATGEEAYSLAILFREALDACERPLRAKIFATDVHRSSLEFAANGVYPQESLSDIEPERVERHFRHVGNGFLAVQPEIRHMVVFAPHDIIRDAPFTKLDLITCRNLLIYLQPATQRTVLSLLHFGLEVGGVLFLGPSETPGDLANEFEPIHRHWKIYRKRRDVRLTSPLRAPAMSARLPSVKVVKPLSQETRLLRAQQALLLRHAPPTLLVDSDFRVVHTFCGGGDYLVHRDGRSTFNVLDMVDSELKLTLNAALQRAQKLRSPVSYGSVLLTADDPAKRAHLHVQPVQDAESLCYLISLELEETPPAPDPDARVDISEISRERIATLEDELRFTKENLQATLEEMETANEELQAANEELVASNEELQSTNEELHSVNEELYTVNAEHQEKIGQLTELTEDMENFFAATDVGTIFLDRDFRIRRFTPRVAELFQLLPHDVGRRISTFAHTLNVPRIADDLSHVLETEEPVEREVRDREGQWYLMRVVPYRVGGAVDGVVLNLVDITALKKTEARLRLMSKVFEDTGDPVVIESVEGTIVDLNPEAERAFGWSRQELLGTSGLRLVPDAEHAQALHLRERCLDEGSVRNEEMLRRDRDGKTHPTLVTLSRIATEDGAPPVIAIIGKDITLRKQAERAAQEAVRRRDEFLAMLSHELRNPLAVIQNAAQVLAALEGRSPDDARQRTTAVILRQVDHMASLLGDLLDVSRVTQGKVELVRRSLDIRTTATEAVEAVSNAIQRRQQRLDVSFGDVPLVIAGDAARLRQIQENLLTNASKYTPDGGRIRIELAHEGDDAVIRVRDTGRGIPADRLEVIFDLFAQGHSTLDRADGGMGVGLTLVRALVELHGGRVFARSDGPNRGSTFEVHLPLLERSEVHPPALDLGLHPGAAKHVPPAPMQILIVEDNTDARETLRALLELDGHRVTVAADGTAGLEAIERGKPQVALVDIGLPKLDGFQLAKRVRERLGASGLKLIALTGYGQPDDRRAIREAGFDLHLVKPVSRENLREALTASEPQN